VKPGELREEIAVELEALEATVNELLALQRDVAHREPTVREKTAAAAFLAQFYNGVENILKRISRYHDVPLPTGDTWHVDLFQRFCCRPIQVFLHCSMTIWRLLLRRFAASGMLPFIVTDSS